jgi:hypothetical protein
MADRHVTKSGKDKDGDITSLCQSGAFWSPRQKADAIADIDGKVHSYFTKDSKGNRADVKVKERNGKKYLTTDADSSSDNNLDNLPDC